MITAAKIKFVRSLSQKKLRIESNLFVAEGSKIINDLAKTKLDIVEVFALEDTTIQSTSATICRASQKDIDRMSNLKTPSDAIALIRIPRNEPLEFDSLTLALDNVQDPGNIGTIIRIADWFGIKRIVCSENCADCFSPKVVQATMGSIARVEVHYTDLYPTLAAAQEQGLPIFGTFLEGENIYQSSLPLNGIIVMGNEGRGISDSVASLITDKILIPPFNPNGEHCESLNVAVATAIVCSEFRRNK